MSFEYNIQYYASLNDITNQPIFEYNTTEPNNLIVGNINDTNGVIGGYTWKIYSIDGDLVSSNTVYRNGTDISSLGNSFKLYKYDIKVYYYSNRSFAESKQTALGSYSISNENATFTLTNKTIDGSVVSQWVIARSSSGTTPPGISTDNIVNADGDYYIFTKPIASLHFYDTESNANAKELVGLYGIQDYYYNSDNVYEASDGTQYINTIFNIDPNNFNYLTSPNSLDTITSNSWLVTSPGSYDITQNDFENYYSEYFISNNDKNLKVNGEWFFYKAPIYEIKYYLYLESETEYPLDIYNKYNNYKVGSANNNNLKGITRWLTNYNDNPLIYYNNGETLIHSNYTFYAAPNYIINFYANYADFSTGSNAVYCGSNATINLGVIYSSPNVLNIDGFNPSAINNWVIDSTDYTNFNPTKWNKVQEKTIITYAQSINFAPTSGTLYNIYPLTYNHSYYSNYTDATEGTNAIRSINSFKPFNLVSIAGHTTKTKWRDLGNATSEYNTGDLLSFTKDYKFYPIYTVIYYENLNDAENNQNIINTYKTSNDNNDNNDLIFGNSINGNFNWIIYKLDDTLQNDPYTIYNNGTALPNAIYTFYLYKAPYTVSYTINYYNTLADITNDNIIYTYTTIDINDLISGISAGNSIGQYNWIIYKIDDNETNSTTVYNYNTNLPQTGLIYYLYKAPEEPPPTTYKITYYRFLQDAQQEINSIGITETSNSLTLSIGNLTNNGDISGLSLWYILNDNTNTTYTNTDTLIADKDYILYPVSYFKINYYVSKDNYDNNVQPYAYYYSYTENEQITLGTANYYLSEGLDPVPSKWYIHNTNEIKNNSSLFSSTTNITYNVYPQEYTITYYRNITDIGNITAQSIAYFKTYNADNFTVGNILNLIISDFDISSVLKWTDSDNNDLFDPNTKLDFIKDYNLYVSPVVYIHYATSLENATNFIFIDNYLQTIYTMSDCIISAPGSWKMADNSYIGTNDQNLIYNNGDTLHFEPVNTYIFYQIYTIQYYLNSNDAIANTGMVNEEILDSNNFVLSSYTYNGITYDKWILSSDNIGSSSKTIIYSTGDSLTFDSNYKVYAFTSSIVNYYSSSDINDNSKYLTTIEINNSYLVNFNYVNENTIIYPRWKIHNSSINTTGTYNTIIIYNNNEVINLAQGIYNVYAVPYSILYYDFNNQPLGDYSTFDSSTFKVGQSSPGNTDIGGKTVWILVNYLLAPISNYVIENDTALDYDSNKYLKFYDKNYINYYNNQIDAENKTNPSGTFIKLSGTISSSDFIVGNTTTGDISLYSNWKISSSSTGTSQRNIVYNNNDSLNITGNYHLYPAPMYTIFYYDTNLENELGINESYDGFTIGTITNSSSGGNLLGYTKWIEVGDQNNIVYSNNDTLTFDRNYYLYAAPMYTIRYYNIDQETLLGTNESYDGFTIGTLTDSGDLLGYTKWKIIGQSNTVYTNNDTISFDRDYDLYPAPMYRITYYSDESKTTVLGINESYDVFTIGTITNSGDLLGYTTWRIIGQSNTVYSNNETLTYDRDYELYAAPMYTITYYSDESKTTELGINESYDGFTIGTITNSSSGGDLLGYTKWKEVGQNNTVYSNNDTLTFDRNYYLYAAPMYTITYYSDESKTTVLGINESYDVFIIGTITNSGNLLGYTKWQEIGQNTAYFNNDTLTFDRDYELYPAPYLIKYYESKSDADSSINVIYTKYIYGEDMAVGDGLTGDITVITSWKIATNSSGTDLTIDDNYLSNGTILTKDGDYNLYPSKSYSIKYYDTYDDLIADLNDNLNPTGRMLKEDIIYTPYNFKPSNYNDINEWIIAHINENNGTSDKKTVYDNTKLLTFDDDYYVYAFKFSKITYYSDINLTTLLGSYSYSSIESFNLGDNVSLNYSIWQISETSASPSPFSTGILYYNGDIMAPGVYNVYIGSYNLSYYDDTDKKIAQYSTTESADFIIGNVSSDSDNISEYTKWLIYDNIIDKTLLYNYIHYNDDLLDFNKNYTLVAFNKNYINYYSNKSDADNKTNPIATLLSNINFVVGSVSYDDTLTASKWLISTSSTGTTNGLVNNNDLLNYDGDYHLYIAEFNIYYYGSLDDALNNTELLNTTTTTDPTDFKISTIGSFNSWRIADNINGNGTSNKGTVYTLNNLLNFDGNYYLYPNVVCFLEGTRILCKINNEEKYINIEYIRPGTLVKTYLHGYKKIYKIGYNKLNNNNIYNEDRPKNMLYKLTKDKYSDLLDDLYITGCHSILTDEITENQLNKTINDNKYVYSTDGKYRLMAYIDDKAELYRKSGIFNIWHFALEHDDYYMNYGVYANGLLVETTSKRFMDKISNLHII